MIDLPPFDALALSLHHAPGVHAVLVGSGLSRTAGIPTGWEITLDLIRRLAALDDISSHDDWAQWYRDKYGKEPSYSEILDALASTPAERRAILHAYIEPGNDEDARKPTKAHHAIAQLITSGAVRVVVTTNFDRLIERALQEVGVEPTVIAGDDAISGATPLVHAKCTIIKVHGDYLDARIKNTDSELEAYSEAMNGLLDQVFDNFGLLAVGWSGEWDTALRSAVLRAPSRRYPFYWAARGTVGPLAQDLIDQRGGRSFPITDADSFFTKLEATLEALRQASRPHPQSLEIAVALAKRLCRDEKFAMEWADFLFENTRTAREFLSGPDFPTASPTNDSLTKLVDTLVIKTEVIRRACLICGRWGTPDAIRSAIRTVNSLRYADDRTSGYVMYSALREFPSSLCFYWLLAGLLDRDDWSSIRALQTTKIKADGELVPLIKKAPFEALGVTSWAFLAGFERHKFPISDYLVTRFRAEARDISLDEKRAEELFDRAEISAALGYVETALDDGSVAKGSYWVPLGRFIWKGEGALDAEMSRIESLADTDPFFIAGMLGGNQEKAAAILKAIRDLRQAHPLVFSRYL